MERSGSDGKRGERADEHLLEDAAVVHARAIGIGDAARASAVDRSAPRLAATEDRSRAAAAAADSRDEMLRVLASTGC